MQLVYIAHPLNAETREGIERNRRNAARWVAWAAARGVAPVATWITLSGEWDESRRDEGLAVDFAIVKRCDALWLVGPRISQGMALEANRAREHGIPVVNLTGRELPP